MEIDWSRIERSSTTFRGIIPSREARCTGKITLDVVFGSPDNYRSKEVTFQVAPFSSEYDAILGREPSTIGLRTNGAGARVVRNLGSSLALKVIAVSLHGFVVATW